MKATTKVLMQGEDPNQTELTPDVVIQATLSCFGGVIDLDPCAESPLIKHVAGQEYSSGQYNVPALNHYTEVIDGLAQPWVGKVYMNPPYARYVIDKWIDKALAEFTAGRAHRIIMLLPSRTETRWMQLLNPFQRCYVAKRLKFKGHTSGAPFPSCIVHLGIGTNQFQDAFEPLGPIFEMVPRRIQ